MRTFLTTSLLTAAACLAIVWVTPSAQADESSEKTDVANSLLPLEVRRVVTPTDSTLLESVTDRINNPEASSATSANTDVLGAGLIDDLVDENGDVNLPLGLMLFDAMGTTSIGFGGSF